MFPEHEPNGGAMAKAVTLLGALAAGCVEDRDLIHVNPRLSRGSRIKARPVAGRRVSERMRTAISLGGNPNQAGVASLYPLRAEIAESFRPTHLSDSTDLFEPSFDIRGHVSSGGIEAHLVFSVERDDHGAWQLRQVTPTTGYPGLRIEDPRTVGRVAAAILQAVTSQRLRSCLPWEPGVLVAASKVVDALRELIRRSARPGPPPPPSP